MMTILLPTDFSKIAQHTVNYATEAAHLMKAKIILFHVYQFPLATGEIPVMYPVEQLEQGIMENLRKTEKHIHSIHKNLIVELQFECGFTEEEIRLAAKKNNVDLIIMGIQGAGYLEEKVLGSVSTALMNNSHCPVLIINKNVIFKKFKKIVFAFDYTEIKNKQTFHLVKEFATLFKSHIYILNVVKQQLEAVSSVTKAVEGMKLGHQLENIDHSFYYEESNDILSAITQFVNEHTIDLVVMIPRKHTALHAIFNEPQTKRMAFHTKIPLLCLQE